MRYNKTFNVYCDESCHLENDHKEFMFLGCVSSAFNQVKQHTEIINEIKKKHNFYAEIKWTNASNSKLYFYYDLIDYFFASDLRFRIVGINKSKINCSAFTQTYDDFYYKMYYTLLNHKVNSQFKYNVYLDIKDSLSANKVKKLKEILNIRYSCSFRNIQNIHSNESVLLQLADLFIGAISHLKNVNNSNNVKTKIIYKIQKRTNLDLSATNYSDKFNIFYIDLQNRK